MVSVSVCFAAGACARPGTGGPCMHCNAEFFFFGGYPFRMGSYVETLRIDFASRHMYSTSSELVRLPCCCERLGTKSPVCAAGCAYILQRRHTAVVVCE